MSVTREKLYDEIWTEPITKVSKRYGVSDSYLIRVLKSLNIPSPPRGYWATVTAGISLAKPSLPRAKPGDAITWSRDGQTEFATSTVAEEKTTRSKRTARIATHGLVSEANEHFKHVRDSKSPYLKPFKKLTIDLIVSKDTLERGLTIPYLSSFCDINIFTIIPSFVHVMPIKNGIHFCTPFLSQIL